MSGREATFSGQNGVTFSRRIAPRPDAPADVLRTLGNDDDIGVAEPVLKLSPRLAETDLVNIVSAKGQGHLRAISERSELGEPVLMCLFGTRQRGRAPRC